jgi:hypothetical protein
VRQVIFPVKLLHDRTRPVIPNRRVRSSLIGVSDHLRSARPVTQHNFRFLTVTLDRRIRSCRPARLVSARFAVSTDNGWICLKGV